MYSFFTVGIALITVGLCVAVVSSGYFRTHNDAAGRGQRIGVILAGIAGIILASGILALRTEFIGNADAARESACRSNMKALSLALIGYAQDWDGHFPPADRWADCIDNKKYVDTATFESLLHCPSAKSPYGYAMNQVVGGKSEYELRDPTTFVLLFETDSNQRNAHGSAAMLADVRHWMLNVAYCDGNVNWVNPVAREHWKWSIANQSPSER